MADEPASTGGDLQSDLASLKPSGGGPLTTKRVFLIGLIAVGAFMFYVIFLKKKAPATPAPTSNSSSVPSNDPSAIGSLQTSLESLQQSLTAQGAELNTIGQNAAGARTNSSIALNGVNDLLHNGSGGGPKPTPGPGPGPKPAPGPLPRVVPIAAPPVTTHQMIIGAPTTVGHLQQTGLAHQ